MNRFSKRRFIPVILSASLLLPGSALALPHDKPCPSPAPAHHPLLLRRQGGGNGAPYTTTEIATRSLNPSEPNYPGMTTETFIDVLTPPPPVPVATTVLTPTSVVLTTTATATATVVKSVEVPVSPDEGTGSSGATRSVPQIPAVQTVLSTITATAPGSGPTTTSAPSSSTATSAPPPPSRPSSSSSPASSSSSSSPSAASQVQEDPNRGSIRHPNDDQIRTLWVAGVMLFVQVVTWQMFLIRELLFPYKMFVNLFHEGSHIFVGVLTGAKLYSVSIDPDRGPISGMTGGIPALSLGAGYLGSQLLGSAFILCSFSISASKVAYITTASLWLGVWWFGRIWSRLKTIVAVAVSIALWFPGQAEPLRFYILFLGMMSTFYPLFDALDDFVFRKQNESDASLFSRISKLAPQAWTILWLLHSCLSFATGALAGIHYFPQSMALQRQAQAHFLPT